MRSERPEHTVSRGTWAGGGGRRRAGALEYEKGRPARAGLGGLARGSPLRASAPAPQGDRGASQGQHAQRGRLGHGAGVEGDVVEGGLRLAAEQVHAQRLAEEGRARAVVDEAELVERALGAGGGIRVEEVAAGAELDGVESVGVAARAVGERVAGEAREGVNGVGLERDEYRFTESGGTADDADSADGQRDLFCIRVIRVIRGLYFPGSVGELVRLDIPRRRFRIRVTSPFDGQSSRGPVWSRLGR